MAPPLRFGLVALLVVSVLYEPMRGNLYRLGSSIGGVGGVGGLTNQWACHTTGGVFGPDVCYERGVFLGLTPFALLVLSLWTMPLAASAAASSFFVQRRDDEPTSTPTSPPPQTDGTTFVTFWIVLELLWFAVPAAAYLSSPFYRSDVVHVVLGIAISAAFPLSWALSVVAIPAPAFVAASAGLPRATVLAAHKVVGWSVVRWAAIHGTGELLYLVVKDRRAFVTGAYRLLYWAGAVAFAVLLVHAIVARFRRRLKYFVPLHKALAAVLLLCAAVHWWPFAFFLCPAVATLATAHALLRALPAATKGDDDTAEDDASSLGSLLLSTSLLAAVAGVCVGWKMRELTLLRVSHPYWPYPFPPLALGLGYVLARITAEALLLKLAPPPTDDLLRHDLLRHGLLAGSSGRLLL
mmetsp:Transcript_24092/g.77680  ORF Transcript_24092/g.77680 Transcript_24092/m.77680 type:complete len:409 (+) Transcript_24092:2184-3410(+)